MRQPPPDHRSANGRIRRGEPPISDLRAPLVTRHRSFVGLDHFPPFRHTFAIGRTRRGGSHVTRHSLHSFTLIELLVVMGIILVMAVALVPAVNSLSKSNGRKAAISNLTVIIEQARSLALSDARNVYVAFVANLPTSVPPSIIDDYSYRAYAVFEDDANGNAHAVQVTKWQKLPVGISFRNQNETSGPGTCLTSTTNTVTGSFTFSPTNTTAVCPYIEFDSTGSVIQPSTAAPMRLVVFEGFVRSGTEVATAKEPSSEPVRDEIEIGRFNGRAKYVVR